VPADRDTLPRYVNRLALLLAVLTFALAGCGGGSGGDDGGEPAGDGTTEAVETPEGELSVAAAKEQGGSGLNGTVFVRLDEWTLCNSLDESSYPPGCGAPSLRIANPDALAAVKLVEGVGQAGGLLWTARPVSVTGDVANDAITVTDVPKG
jgi:hypothetical protein